MPGGPIAYQVAYQGGEEVPKTAFNIPTSATALTSTRTLFQDACLAAMAAYISSGRDKELGNDAGLAFRCTQIGREMCNQIERYST